MINILQENSFKKDLRRMQRRGKDLKKVLFIIELVSQNKALPIKYRDHKLSGNWSDFRECHIEPDWLLIYKKTNHDLILVRTGSHSDLF